MNNERRKRIGALIDRLEEIRDAVNDLENEERESFENMPESLQQSERGEQCEAAAEKLADAVNNIEWALQELEGAGE